MERTIHHYVVMLCPKLVLNKQNVTWKNYLFMYIVMNLAQGKSFKIFQINSKCFKIFQNMFFSKFIITLWMDNGWKYERWTFMDEIHLWRCLVILKIVMLAIMLVVMLTTMILGMSSMPFNIRFNLGAMCPLMIHLCNKGGYGYVGSDVDDDDVGDVIHAI